MAEDSHKKKKKKKKRNAKNVCLFDARSEIADGAKLRWERGQWITGSDCRQRRFDMAHPPVHSRLTLFSLRNRLSADSERSLFLFCSLLFLCVEFQDGWSWISCTLELCMDVYFVWITTPQDVQSIDMFVLLDEIWLCGDPSNIRILRSDILTYTDYWSSGDDLRPVSATTTNCPCFVPTVIYGVRVGEREKDGDEQRKQIERHFSSHGGIVIGLSAYTHARAHTHHGPPLSGVLAVLSLLEAVWRWWWWYYRPGSSCSARVRVAVWRVWGLDHPRNVRTDNYCWHHSASQFLFFCLSGHREVLARSS